MPIYEYQCKGCGHKFEAIQRISDEPLKDCPECDKAELKKLISAVGFRLKGGGWYETDFKNGGKKKNLASDKSASDKSGSDKAGSDKSGSESSGAKATSSGKAKKTGS